jgi:hypothetical protein
MNRLHVAAATLWMCVASLAASAISLEPIAGSTPQSTRELSYFPNPIGVIVRDSVTGNPVAGVSVVFSWSQPDPDGATLIAPDTLTPGDVVAISGPDGVAVPPQGFVTFSNTGTLVLTATADTPDQPATASFLLTVLPGPPLYAVLISGDEQVAPPGGLYASPWVVRLLDAGGNPVPYGAGYFYTDPDSGTPGVSWNGAGHQWVKADAGGIATSGPMRANAIAGWGWGIGAPAAGNGVWFHFGIVVPPYAASATLLSGPPASVEVGHATIAPWVVRVNDSLGQPVAGVPVDFVSPCAGFGGAERARVVSDIHGIAASPLFNATAVGFCSVSIEAAGVPPDHSLNLTLYVFDPANVVITASPHYIVTREGTRFSVDVAFTESSYPIYGAPFDVQVVAEPHGASATLLHEQTSYGSNVATLEFAANGRSGHYAIVVKRGPVRTWVAVEQRGR